MVGSSARRQRLGKCVQRHLGSGAVDATSVSGTTTTAPQVEGGLGGGGAVAVGRVLGERGAARGGWGGRRGAAHRGGGAQNDGGEAAVQGFHRSGKGGREGGGAVVFWEGRKLTPVFPFVCHHPHTHTAMDTPTPTPHTLANFLFPDDLCALALARCRAVGAAPPAPRRAPRAVAAVVASPAAFDEARGRGGG